MQTITYVGRVVHKVTVAAAVADGELGGDVRHIGVLGALMTCYKPASPTSGV